MDLRQLDMLLAVAQTGSYSKAGENMRISHSAIHRQVRMLEHEVGDRILVRSGRRIELTETGTLITQLARRVQQDIAETQRHISERNQLQSGHLRIGTGTTMLVFFLPPVIQAFRKRFPGVDVRIVTGTAGDILRDIQAGSLDLGVILDPADLPRQARPLHCEVLYTEEFVLAVRKNHPLTRSPAVTLSRVAEFPLIAHSRTSHIRGVIDARFAAAGVTPNISMELENEEAMEKMIQINMGVAPISKRRAVQHGIPYVALADPAILCDVGLVYAKSEYASAALREFTALCRQFAKASD